jgi:hypothetical protein
MTRKTRSQTSTGQILDDELANQINDALESSDGDSDGSYDDLGADMGKLGEQILNLAADQDILPKLTESQLQIKLNETNESIFEALQSILPIFEPIFLALRGMNKYFLNPKPIQKVAHLLYMVFSFIFGLLIFILNTLASSWQLTITAMHKAIITTDKCINSLYRDRRLKQG